jgi:hypothetical protein
MLTPSWTVSFTTPTASNSPAKACVGPEANSTTRLDQTSSPVTKIHRSARLATRAASFRSGGRHHSGIPGGIIPLYPGDFVGIRTFRQSRRSRPRRERIKLPALFMMSKAGARVEMGPNTTTLLVSGHPRGNGAAGSFGSGFASAERCRFLD